MPGRPPDPRTLAGGRQIDWLDPGPHGIPTRQTAFDLPIPALQARFRDHTMPLFERHGITNIGYWTAVTGEGTEDSFIYMLAYPSREARDEMWRTLGADPDFQRLIVSAERSEERKLVETIDTRLLAPTEYSPLK